MDLPPPHPLTTVGLLGLAGVAWLATRVHLLRRREGRRDAGEEPVAAPAWMRRLARWPGTPWAAAATGLAFAALAVLGALAAGGHLR